VSAGSFVEVIVLVFQSCELYRLLDMPQEVWESFVILLAFKLGERNTITKHKEARLVHFADSRYIFLFLIRLSVHG
jgi:hypothetical protein